MLTHVNFTCVNLEAMYEVSRVNIKVEPRSTFRFTRDTSDIASILFMEGNFTSVSASTLRGS